MFTSLSDFSHFHYDPSIDAEIFYTPFADRVISVALHDSVYVVCSNTELYDPTSSDPYCDWNDTETSSQCSDSLETALKIATSYATSTEVKYDRDLLAYMSR